MHLMFFVIKYSKMYLMLSVIKYSKMYLMLFVIKYIHEITYFECRGVFKGIESIYAFKNTNVFYFPTTITRIRQYNCW
jgi:hypothetical protein